MIRVECTGDFNNINRFLERARKLSITDILNRYGQIGVEALAAATPKDTGATASNWNYTIKQGLTSSTITWTNDEINDGIPVAILIQYGHGTRNGGYVAPVDFINPAIRDVLQGIADSVWKEVTRV